MPDLPVRYRQRRKGDRLPYVPRLAASASLLLDGPVGERLRLQGSLHYSYLGRSRVAFAQPGAFQPRVGRTGALDLDAGFAFGDARLSLLVQNLTNDRGSLCSGINAGNAQVGRRRPRSAGLSTRDGF